MKKLLSLFVLFTISLSLAAQDVTGDALRAKKVTKMVFVRKGLDKDGKPALTFAADSREVDDDNFVSNISVSVPERQQTIAIKVDFENPLKYKITTDLTSVDDPSFEAISKFAEQVSQFNSLINAQKTSQQSGGVVPAPVLPPGLSGRELIAAGIKGPSLAEWKYTLVKGKDDNCIKDFDALASLIYDVDTSYYTRDEKIDFNKLFVAAFNELQAAPTAKVFSEELEEFQKVIKALEARIKKHKEHHSGLEKRNTNALVAATVAGKTYCADFVAYTKSELEQYLVITNGIQKNREDLIKAANSLVVELKKVKDRIDTKDGVIVNSFVLSKIAVDPKKIQDMKITYGKQNIEVTDNEIKITKDENQSLAGSVKVRAHRTLIPEISTGVFYTNLAYPKFGVTEDGGVTKVSNAGEDKYRMVAATHLNLVANIFDGLAHPMLQIGVGTGKELPSMLGGAGLRFTGDVKFAVSFGALFTWRKELDKLKIGDEVKGTAELENDLKYTLQKKPSFYIGLQYNF